MEFDPSFHSTGPLIGPKERKHTSAVAQPPAHDTKAVCWCPWCSPACVCVCVCVCVCMSTGPTDFKSERDQLGGSVEGVWHRGNPPDIKLLSL